MEEKIINGWRYYWEEDDWGWQHYREQDGVVEIQEQASGKWYPLNDSTSATA